MIEWINKRLEEFENDEALIVNGKIYLYSDILKGVDRWTNKLKSDSIHKKEVVALFGDFSAEMLFALLALAINENIILPIASEKEDKLNDMLNVARADKLYIFDDANVKLKELSNTSTHPLLEKLRVENDAGIMIFTSGSTGEGKCALHRFSSLTYKSKKEVKRRALRTLVFLKMDHIGGINTIFSILFQGGTMVLINDRTIKTVCSSIEKYKVQLLPTTPSFINMMIISGACKNYDLSSLMLITYGTEVMPITTLKAINEEMPYVKIRQTYGLTEMGIFSTKSKDNSSLWMKVGGDGVETKIKNNILFIRSPYAMLGYLNASSPFDDEGWYNTGDEVRMDGEYLHILGRKEEIINVGGEKVFPAEIENVLLRMSNVQDVVVYGKKSPITGQIVVAEFCLINNEDEKLFKKRVLQYAKGHLEPYKIPRIITISNKNFIGSNLKKKRFI
ncbi:MAG: fatty acid--CoA ligase family protein [Acutalibacteraceae bacterium]|nr:fatty acid--CoA ligase family protein [Acutalibacteraceae bacterium]